MALSGLVLVGFVVGHMLGNLQILLELFGEGLGREALNDYAALLQGNKLLLWGARIVLLAAVLAHLYSAWVLTMRSRAARPAGYSQHKWLSGSYAVRTMRWGGVIVLAFIVYHLMHLTVGSEMTPEIRHCEEVGGALKCYVFENVVRGFSSPGVVIFYVVAQLALGFHLAHGIWSLFRTLGMGNPRFDSIIRKVAAGTAGMVTLGNVIIPVAVLVGLIGGAA